MFANDLCCPRFVVVVAVVTVAVTITAASAAVTVSVALLQLFVRAKYFAIVRLKIIKFLIHVDSASNRQRRANYSCQGHGQHAQKNTATAASQQTGQSDVLRCHTPFSCLLCSRLLILFPFHHIFTLNLRFM